VVAEVDRLHSRTLSAMEARYASQVSSLEDELQGVVTASRVDYQAAYAQLEGSASSSEVASQLRGIPRHLEEIA